MSIIAKTHRQIRLGHICSQCGQPLVQDFTLYADGRANAFFHEREMAEEALVMAVEQAYKDILKCRQTPRQLGSMTEVFTNKNRMWAFYQIEKLDEAPCKCGHLEPWQLRKKSLWNPVDNPFDLRAKIPDLPLESRPALLETQEAMDAWCQDPGRETLPLPEDKAAIVPVGPSSADFASDESAWVCFKCGISNKGSVQTCQGCGVSRQWSEAKTAQKKK